MLQSMEQESGGYWRRVHRQAWRDTMTIHGSIIPGIVAFLWIGLICLAALAKFGSTDAFYDEIVARAGIIVGATVLVAATYIWLLFIAAKKIFEKQQVEIARLRAEIDNVPDREEFGVNLLNLSTSLIAQARHPSRDRGEIVNQFLPEINAVNGKLKRHFIPTFADSRMVDPSVLSSYFNAVGLHLKHGNIKEARLTAAEITKD
jgi:hypothetical protein